jgi:hypothetical protein
MATLGSSRRLSLVVAKTPTRGCAGYVQRRGTVKGLKEPGLPPYSPDMNPIEEAFSKVKGTLRKAGSRMRDALVEATGRALDAITPEDIRGFYAACGAAYSCSRCEDRSRVAPAYSCALNEWSCLLLRLYAG